MLAERLPSPLPHITVGRRLFLADAVGRHTLLKEGPSAAADLP
ncbi:hypothetical protein Tco_0742335, partial [Tanacetum coccineum]